MQSRYVGDIGDYIKFAILRSLGVGYELGVAWWLVKDENHNKDGRHISYLNKPDRWKKYDPILFDNLKDIVDGNRRNIHELEKLISNARYFSKKLPLNLKNYTQRPLERRAWFEEIETVLQECNFIFLDPDNGLEPQKFCRQGKKSIKSVTFAELEALNRPGRTMLVYHHHTRRKGGHSSELAYQASRIQKYCRFKRVDALRVTPYSPRIFFLLNADEIVRTRAVELAKKWGGHITWHDHAALLSQTTPPTVPS